MATKRELPYFDDRLPFLDQFILELVESYQAKKLQTWGELDHRVKTFFTPVVTEHLESLVMGWKKMTSYSNGITQTHVMCVFLGTYMMEEYQALSLDEKQIAKWIVLFHDLDKFHIKGKKDTLHAFKSAVLAVQGLQTLGFAVKDEYHKEIDNWSKLTQSSYKQPFWKPNPIPDNKKLPKILNGVDQLFGKDTPASIITKVVLLHISIAADPNYPSPAPLNNKEIKAFLTPRLFSFLKIMMLGDIEGWSLFEPEIRAQQYRDAYIAFEKTQTLIAPSG